MSSEVYSYIYEIFIDNGVLDIYTESGIRPWSHFTNPDPTGTVVAYILSTHSKSTNIHALTTSTIESMAPTS